MSSLVEPSHVATIRGGVGGPWTSIEDEWGQEDVHSFGSRGEVMNNNFCMYVCMYVKYEYW